MRFCELAIRHVLGVKNQEIRLPTPVTASHFYSACDGAFPFLFMLVAFGLPVLAHLSQGSSSFSLSLSVSPVQMHIDVGVRDAEIRHFVADTDWLILQWFHCDFKRVLNCYKCSLFFFLSAKESVSCQCYTALHLNRIWLVFQNKQELTFLVLWWLIS